jgi:hypothetical protein
MQNSTSQKDKIIILLNDSAKSHAVIAPEDLLPTIQDLLEVEDRVETTVCKKVLRKYSGVGFHPSLLGEMLEILTSQFEVDQIEAYDFECPPWSSYSWSSYSWSNHH